MYRTRYSMTCCLVSLSLLVLTQNASAKKLQFQKSVIDPNIGKVCYAVTAADVDGDNRLDIVAISEREAMWYRNPDWKKHVMISDAVTKDHVCITAGDIDGDGKVDFAMGAGWPKRGEIFGYKEANHCSLHGRHPIGVKPGRIA